MNQGSWFTIDVDAAGTLVIFIPRVLRLISEGDDEFLGLDQFGVLIGRESTRDESAVSGPVVGASPATISRSDNRRLLSWLRLRDRWSPREENRRTSSAAVILLFLV